jgi:hypothetical protein
MAHTFGNVANGCYHLLLLHLGNVGCLDIMGLADVGSLVIGINLLKDKAKKETKL